MKQLFRLDKFAFVDTKGLIYTSLGTEENIAEYHFDPATLKEPEVSIFNPAGGKKQVIIAVPVSIPFGEEEFRVCFMAIDMSEMLAGVSMETQGSDTTFSNIYAADGTPLTEQVLGGLAAEDNLLEALKRAEFEQGYSYEQVVADFAAGTKRAVSFVYGTTPETLSYVPVKGTVIDDDPVACEHAHVILEQVGISCETALSGEEGLEMVKVRHARREDYNLILVDWKMPEKDGVETTREIRGVLGETTPIIILTSYNWDEIAEEARQAGVDTFVSKPQFAGTVMEEFREAFKRKNEQRAGKKADLRGRRVLLAEDVAVNAEIMEMVLSMREIRADLAENGRIAVEKFAEHPAGTYDAILMDMRMPEMDGLEATSRIRAMDRADSKTIPIIALTANAFDEDVQRSLQAGLNAHLSKPVDPETLFGTLESLIV